MFWFVYFLGVLAVGSTLVYIGLILIYYIYYRYFRKFQPPIGCHCRVKREKALHALFISIPKRLVKDALARSPGFFRYQGLIIFTGRQGSGKTIAMTKQLLDYQSEYPYCKILTNYGFRYQDAEITDWRDLIGKNNGIEGVAIGLDELQNWFSSGASRDFPPQMLETITQNRKNRRVILGTAQTFNRLAKPIREQTTEVRFCYTFFGVLTVVVCKYPDIGSDGDVKRWKPAGFYWFVHNEFVRTAYDTWYVVEALAKSGFLPQGQQPEISVVVSSSSRSCVKRKL